MVDSFSGYPSLLLVLTGFMGTGKTSVGQVLANRLSRDFVDMDVAIEAEEGMSIRENFATHGERYFRDREADWCARLANTSNLVVATGGGTLVNPLNRAKFDDALVVCLDAAPDVILDRLQDSQGRPLLETDDTRRRITELMAARREAYAQIEYHVETT